MLRLYTGNLLQGNEEEWVVNRSVTLHTAYLKLVYQYLNLLKEQELYEEIINVCRTALDVDAFDETLHLQLMNALVKTCLQQRSAYAVQACDQPGISATWACSPRRAFRSFTSRSFRPATPWK